MSDLLSTTAEALRKACDAAYDHHLSSCSHAVWSVLKAVFNEDEPYRQANSLVDHMAGHWDCVDLEDGWNLAQTGKVVVGGLKVDGGSGHVVVIYPGAKILNGGYLYNYKGKQLTLRGKNFYPRCLSTSSGSWPGAKSKGDKTVWDPWGKDDAFATVKFYTPPS